MLRSKVALVTGGSRGIGRGIALQLGESGATVYVTGRKPSEADAARCESAQLPSLESTVKEISARGGKGIAVYCDHSKDDDIKALFEQIDEEQNGQLDILVNNAYAAVDFLTKSGGEKFWQHSNPAHVWDIVNNVGLRNHYICSAYAAEMMVKKQQGLIVNVSSAGGLKYAFSVAYGVGKEAVDRMAADMAHELKSHNVCCVSLWPGAVRTELITHNIIDNPDSKMKTVPGMAPTIKEMFEAGETTEFSGKCIANLAADPQLMSFTGKIHTTGDLGLKYGLKDTDGRTIQSMRSVKYILNMFGYSRSAAWVPSWLRLPGWMISLSGAKM